MAMDETVTDGARTDVEIRTGHEIGRGGIHILGQL